MTDEPCYCQANGEQPCESSCGDAPPQCAAHAYTKHEIAVWLAEQKAAVAEYVQAINPVRRWAPSAFYANPKKFDPISVPAHKHMMDRLKVSDARLHSRADRFPKEPTP